MERGSRKRSSSAESEKMESWWQIRKMEGHCSIGESPKWAVVPMEEGEEEEEEEEDNIRQIPNIMSAA